MENNQKFTWLKHWKGNVFIYENPFTQYGLFTTIVRCQKKKRKGLGEP